MSICIAGDPICGFNPYSVNSWFYAIPGYFGVHATQYPQVATMRVIETQTGGQITYVAVDSGQNPWALLGRMNGLDIPPIVDAILTALMPVDVPGRDIGASSPREIQELLYSSVGQQVPVTSPDQIDIQKEAPNVFELPRIQWEGPLGQLAALIAILNGVPIDPAITSTGATFGLGIPLLSGPEITVPDFLRPLRPIPAIDSVPITSDETAGPETDGAVAPAPITPESGEIARVAQTPVPAEPMPQSVTATPQPAPGVAAPTPPGAVVAPAPAPVDPAPGTDRFGSAGRTRGIGEHRRPGGTSRSARARDSGGTGGEFTGTCGVTGYVRVVELRWHLLGGGLGRRGRRLTSVSFQ